MRRRHGDADAQTAQILVPTDFSDAANAAKDYATVLAEAFGATLHVLHVIPDPLTMGWGVDAAYLPQLLERTERAVQEQLDAALPPAEREKFRMKSAVDTGAPADGIVRYAAQHGIDLIVMGRRRDAAPLSACGSAASRRAS